MTTKITKKKMEEPACMGCGMQIDRHEYHPHAACLMFKSCKNDDEVRKNLEAVISYGKKGGRIGRI